jgi:hypothetical protein
MRFTNYCEFFFYLQELERPMSHIPFRLFTGESYRVDMVESRPHSVAAMGNLQLGCTNQRDLCKWSFTHFSLDCTDAKTIDQFLIQKTRSPLDSKSQTLTPSLPLFGNPLSLFNWASVDIAQAPQLNGSFSFQKQKKESPLLVDRYSPQCCFHFLCQEDIDIKWLNEIVGHSFLSSPHNSIFFLHVTMTDLFSSCYDVAMNWWSLMF